jgi:hypothetical protein
MTKRWADIVDQKPDSGRSGDEIAAEVIERAKLRVKRAACEE